MMPQEILRGQIFYVTGTTPPTGAEIWGDRPGIIVSNDVNNKYSDAVSVVYLTTNTKKHYSPVHVNIHSSKKPAIAMCEQVHSVDKSRLRDYMGRITPQEQKQIDAALALSLGYKSENYIGIFKKWENYINKYKLNNLSPTEIEDPELKKRLKILTAERDGYKSLYEAVMDRLEVHT